MTSSGMELAQSLLRDHLLYWSRRPWARQTQHCLLESQHAIEKICFALLQLTHGFEQIQALETQLETLDCTKILKSVRSDGKTMSLETACEIRSQIGVLLSEFLYSCKSYYSTCISVFDHDKSCNSSFLKKCDSALNDIQILNFEENLLAVECNPDAPTTNNNVLPLEESFSSTPALATENSSPTKRDQPLVAEDSTTTTTSTIDCEEKKAPNYFVY